jgi:hypothetical protein
MTVTLNPNSFQLSIPVANSHHEQISEDTVYRKILTECWEQFKAIKRNPEEQNIKEAMF